VVFNKKSLFWVLVTKKPFRLWEIDFLRGIAVVMMIVFHFFYDLNFFSIYEIDLHSGPFPLFLYPIGTTFLLLVGISLSLSYSRIEDNENRRQLQLKFIFRGSKMDLSPGWLCCIWNIALYWTIDYSCISLFAV